MFKSRRIKVTEKEGGLQNYRNYVATGETRKEYKGENRPTTIYN